MKDFATIFYIALGLSIGWYFGSLSARDSNCAAMPSLTSGSGDQSNNVASANDLPSLKAPRVFTPNECDRACVIKTGFANLSLIDDRFGTRRCLCRTNRPFRDAYEVIDVP